MSISEQTGDPTIGSLEPLAEATPPEERRREATAASDQLAAEARGEERQEANQFLSMGLGIGAIGAATAVAFGAVCPVCVVAAPALITLGVVKRVRAGRGR